ncbi:MAG: hypothetical protein Q8S13_01095, partial [Dehalococcoidia bacterium]|nr:hypothetical protein [Dehalococcoidia bacterium]
MTKESWVPASDPYRLTSTAEAPAAAIRSIDYAIANGVKVISASWHARAVRPACSGDRPAA